jgi:hypothetical protein
MRDFEMMPISHHPSLIAKEAPNFRIDSIYRWQGYAFFTWNENEASSMTMASDPPPLLQRLFLRRPEVTLIFYMARDDSEIRIDIRDASGYEVESELAQSMRDAIRGQLVSSLQPCQISESVWYSRGGPFYARPRQSVQSEK